MSGPRKIGDSDAALQSDLFSWMQTRAVPTDPADDIGETELHAADTQESAPTPPCDLIQAEPDEVGIAPEQAISDGAVHRVDEVPSQTDLIGAPSMDVANDVVIEVTPLVKSPGRFLGRLVGSEQILVASSSQPFIDAARALLANGHDPGSVISMRYTGSDYDALRASLRSAAEPRFRKVIPSVAATPPIAPVEEDLGSPRKYRRGPAAAYAVIS